MAVRSLYLSHSTTSPNICNIPWTRLSSNKIQVAFNSAKILRDHAHQSYQYCHRMYPIICIHTIMYVYKRTCVTIWLTWTCVCILTCFSPPNAPDYLHLMVTNKQENHNILRYTKRKRIQPWRSNMQQKIEYNPVIRSTQVKWTSTQTAPEI